MSGEHDFEFQLEFREADEDASAKLVAERDPCSRERTQGSGVGAPHGGPRPIERVSGRDVGTARIEGRRSQHSDGHRNVTVATHACIASEDAVSRPIAGRESVDGFVVSGCNQSFRLCISGYCCSTQTIVQLPPTDRVSVYTKDK